MKNGIYFLHPEGSAWIVARFQDGELQSAAYEADAGTHQAANDTWAGIVPQDTDVEVDDEDDCKEIILQVMGEDTDSTMVVVAHPAPEYVLYMHEGSTHEEVIFDEQPDNDDINSEIEDWVNEGEWGDDGASVSVGWTLEEDGDEIDGGWYTVDIEPDHSSLISNACGSRWDSRQERSCGDDPDDHDWTAEGEGGCTENPGVWSKGGTSMSFATHCRKCGLHRTEYHTGHQRNPGEHNTVRYEMPENWCAVCEDEGCKYHVNEQYICFTDCDDDEPNGEKISSHDSFDDAMEAAKEYAHEHHVKKPDMMTIALDDTEDGDGEYHVFLVD